MKQFFKFTFASMLGFILAGVFLTGICILIIYGIVSTAENKNKTDIVSNTVLFLEFDKPIHERGSKNPLEGFNFRNFSATQDVGLNDILRAIRESKTDSRIKGIYMEPSSISAGMGTIEEIRNALLDFKTSGKFVVSYAESYSQGAYYLASISDQILLNPQGIIEFKGLRTEMLFFKGMLEKLEVEPEIIRHGKFKSAVEPFMYDRMSPENRQQISVLIHEIWSYFIMNISKSRNITEKELSVIANDMLVKSASDAVRFKLADKLTYKDEVISILKKRSGVSVDKSKPNTISLSKYIANHPAKSGKKFTKEKIAVIYASGEITSNDEDDDKINSSKLSAVIRKARLDKNIKAIVLRVNSPGGSALASDVIWREVMLANQVKPVVVSMGDVAASGGYYISCGARKIFAEPTTITGSIGVFGVLFNLKNLANSKLGITVDTVKTGRFANLGSPFWPLNPAEREIIQQEVEMVYDTFITRVSMGRNISRVTADSIGQGRVWNAISAKRLKLVDKIGGIQDAILEAASLAKIKDYRISELPEQKEAFEKIISQLSGGEDKIMARELGDSYKYYARLKTMLQMSKIQARIPFDLEIY
jgi:protease-4